MHTCRYNSYNQDYGLDVYEEDFIDDFVVEDAVAYITPVKPQKRVKKRNRASRMKSSSDSDSSDSDVRTKSVPRRLILSSDEDAKRRVEAGAGVPGAGTSEEKEETVQVRTTVKRHRSYRSQLTSSSEEGGSATGKDRKCRKVKKWESDEEIE